MKKGSEGSDVGSSQCSNKPSTSNSRRQHHSDQRQSHSKSHDRHSTRRKQDSEQDQLRLSIKDVKVPRHIFLDSEYIISLTLWFNVYLND